MIADELFLVDRRGRNYYSKGSDISTKMVAGDSVLVQRGTDNFKATYNGGSWDKIQDSDLILAWDGTDNRKVSGQNFKSLFLPPPEVVTIPVIRFMPGETNQYGQVKYEIVELSTWNRPAQKHYGYWSYTRDNSYWYTYYDEYGTKWFDNNVMYVRYEDRHQFEGTYYSAFSKNHEPGK